MSLAPAPIQAVSPTEALLDRLETGVALLDAANAIIYANPAFCELFAASPSRSRGLTLHALGDGEQVLAPLAARVRAQGMGLHLRAQQLDTRGSRALHADINISPWDDEIVLIEVHELGVASAAASTPRLSESLRGLAHEVKNPLAGVRGAAQLLKRRLTDPELARLAELVISEADRLGALADRLLQPGGKPHLAAINLHEVAERARELIVAEAQSRVRVERDYDPSLPGLRGNHDRLLQLVLNLMRNALQAHAARITLRSRAEHNVLIGDKPVRLAVRLDVIDDGRGVPEDLRESLFMPLVSGRSDGSGLGLALAREIASEHGGVLSYRSRPGNTVFSLILPLGGEARAHG
jgi:two-component system nitrogen regulation sensor histidine kinase GlnL